MGTPASFITDALQDIRKAGLYRTPRVIEDIRGPYVTIDGREVLCFCSNDYLGMSQRSEPAEAAASAAREFGWGRGAARLLSGTTPWHVELEHRIAQFKKTEAALYFPAGYMANLAMITTLGVESAVLISDQLNHASVVDGCRLARAKVEIYEHAKVDAAIDLLRKHKDVERKIVVTDALFSMDGDLAPLRELQGLVDYHGGAVIIDDAHGTGILGANGRGTLEHLSLEGSIGLQSGGFGKAFGASGGFLAGSHDMIDLVRNRARSFVYTTAPPAAVCAATIAAIDLVEQAGTERGVLWRNVRQMRDALRSAGFDLGDSESPILPLLLGDNDRAMKASEELFRKGFFVPAIRPPTVPDGTARLRISLSSIHEPEHLEALVEAIRTL